MLEGNLDTKLGDFLMSQTANTGIVNNVLHFFRCLCQLFKISLVIRLTRAGMKETMQQDYIKYARAKGLAGSRVVFVHAFRNTLIPLVTVLGLEMGSVIAFAVVTETVFSWPGMGKLIIDSINLLDRPVIVAYRMLTVLMFVVINLVVDITYSAIDPRVRLSEADD